MGNLEDLKLAMEAGDYNAKPTKLRQGCMYIVKDDGTEPTEADYDLAHKAQAAGLWKYTRTIAPMSPEDKAMVIERYGQDGYEKLCKAFGIPVDPADSTKDGNPTEPNDSGR
jgi:hypothetical protein